ncbi:sugar transferase [Slackia isoflavoniconvertens]|uniref:sugar transferase n=1 Tax=Slackia isoflavoniconvertens TaxID=572010 RepID=UPI003CFD80AF
MQLGEATYSDICAEGRDSIKPRSVGLDRDGYSYEDRREAARVDATGKYEPKLTENGIPDEVLAKLLPGDDVIELSEPTIAGGIGYRFAKRAFDIVSCGCALILLAIPMGVMALKIKLESPGPVIYAQRRVGKNGKIFNVYKFRSMYVDAEKRGAQWAQGDDPRVTPFGKVMRKTRMAPVIIGTPGDGEPTKSLSHPVNSSLDLHKCERRPEPFLVAQTHYTSSRFLSFAVFGGLNAARGRSFCACGATSSKDFRAVL